MLVVERHFGAKWWTVLVALAAVLVAGYTVAQEQGNVTTPVCTKNPKWDTVGTGSTREIGIRIEWQVGCDSSGVPIVPYDSFYVLHFEKPASSTYDTDKAKYPDYYIYTNLDTTQQHFFKVRAYSGGRMAYETPSPVEWRPTLAENDIIIWPGYWFLRVLVLATILDDSAVESWDETSTMGKWAFTLIAVFFVVGCVVWIFRTHPTLRSTNAFLVNKEVGGDNECDRLLKEPEIAKLDTGVKEKIKRLIKTRLTRRHFMGKLAFLEWSLFEGAVRNRQDQVELRNNPTVRVVLTGATSLDKEEELETALNVRVQAEEEELRKRSFIDALWALGVTAPLVGLFGTVTGISMSFKDIMDRGIRDERLIEELAKGIHEALYTTICGLIVGILMMLAYYWYNYKLERIHAIWVVFASDFVDRLKRKVFDAKADREKQEAAKKAAEAAKKAAEKAAKQSETSGAEAGQKKKKQ